MNHASQKRCAGSADDKLGHRAGDGKLKAIAAALKKHVRETDPVARIGGDEFAVLLPYADTAQSAVSAADLRLAISDSSVELGGQPAQPFSVSIGVAQIDRDTPGEEVALTAADAAMYGDKARARLDPLG